MARGILDHLSGVLQIHHLLVRDIRLANGKEYGQRLRADDRTRNGIGLRALGDRGLLGGYGGGMDFFQLKGAVERILAGLRITDVTFEAEHDNPSYHPGRCAKVYAGGKLLGVLGQIHPLAAANYGVDAELYTAELWLGELLAARGATPVYTPLPRFPAVTRDIAIVCAADIPVAKLSACILAAGGQYLKGCELFDVYTGAPIPVGYKSVAFSLTLRADDQTLTDDHAEETMQSVLKALKETFNATIR